MKFTEPRILQPVLQLQQVEELRMMGLVNDLIQTLQNHLKNTSLEYFILRF